jgi:N-glycosidase YbiA
VTTPTSQTSRDPEAIYFYGGPFSNFAISPMVIDGRTWRTVEHYYQANKAMTVATYEHIREAPSAREAKTRGRAIECRPDWEQVKYDIMLAGLRAKFALPQFKSILLATDDKPLHEDPPASDTTDWGWRTKDLLGKALMQVRAELRGA